MVYVINFEGKPLMPTTNAKARKLLKQKKATVKRVNPFIIQLLYKTDTEYIQTITLGIDSG
ncbi:TPA: RRXRR domain-containing protein, partial [Clostridioides difficile]|nr:RRXRR domain-containing protein [Clostridioides difficile]